MVSQLVRDVEDQTFLVQGYLAHKKRGGQFLMSEAPQGAVQLLLRDVGDHRALGMCLL